MTVKSPTQLSQKSRCYHCQKKIPLSLRGMLCQCNQQFCSKHRLPENHNCEFDFRKAHFKNSEKNIASMKCVAKKIEQI